MDSSFARIQMIRGLARGALVAGAVCVALPAAPAQGREDQPGSAGRSKMHAKAAGSAKKAPAKGASTETPPTNPQANPDTPASEPPPPPYEGQILRLAEILGALTYLDDLCGFKDSDDWRARMQALLEAEAKTTFRKERLAGAFNRSFRGYERSYRACTPNAQAIITRFLSEGGALAHDVANRYRAS